MNIYQFFHLSFFKTHNTIYFLRPQRLSSNNIARSGCWLPPLDLTCIFWVSSDKNVPNHLNVFNSVLKDRNLSIQFKANNRLYKMAYYLTLDTMVSIWGGQCSFIFLLNWAQTCSFCTKARGCMQNIWSSTSMFLHPFRALVVPCGTWQRHACVHYNAQQDYWRKKTNHS